MMQSILMTPPTNVETKAGKTENNADLKNDLSTAETEKSTSVFSELLDLVLGESKNSTEKLEDVTDSDGADGADGADSADSADSIDGKELSMQILDDTKESEEKNVVVDMSVNIGSEDGSKILAENKVAVDGMKDLVDKDDSSEGGVVDETMDALFLNAPINSQGIIKTPVTDGDFSKSAENIGMNKGELDAETSRLLAKIETAQKTNAQLTHADVKGSNDISLEDEDKTQFNTFLALNKKTQTKEKEGLSALLEKTMSKEEKENGSDSIRDKVSVMASMESKDKRDHALAFKTEILTGSINVDQDLSKNRNLSSLNKLAELGNSNDKQNLLEKPFELHAKHASEMLGKRILMMINQGKQEVSIRLDPAELGSMHIKLVMHQDQLQLHIQTQNGQSRDLIEQHLPKLRDQLAQQGINLNASNVEQQSQQQRQQQQQQSSLPHHQDSSVNVLNNNISLLSDEQMSLISSKIVSSDQGIDFYA